MTRDTVIGLDVGTTRAKALIRPLGEPQTLIVEERTPWQVVTGSGTELEAGALLALAVDLVGQAVRAAERSWGPVNVRAVSVTGLAESGVLLDPRGRPLAPAIAWFDRRGDADLARVTARDPGFAGEFPAVTGLPWSFQASFAKLLWLVSRAGVPRGSAWLSVPEWIVHGLGGDRRREPSLASRTGLIDQNTGEPWPAALAAAELPDGFLPDALPAGSPAGRLRHDDLPACAQGAVLSIAGHDHPVGAVGVGAAGVGEMFNSCGTADVIARSVPSPLSNAQRAAVVAAGWSAGRHVVAGADLLLAGGSGGLLLRRVLDALGAGSGRARSELDAAGAAVDDLPAGLIVAGDGRSQPDVEIRIRDGATPAAIWAAAARYTADLSRQMIAGIEPTVGPHARAVAAGGWIRMRSVRDAKAGAIGCLEFSETREPGATGAALLAEYSLDAAGGSLAEFCLRSPVRSPLTSAEGRR